MKKHLINIYTFSVVLFLFSGCANYKASSLNTLSSKSLQSSSESIAKDDISIAAKTFDIADCRKYLDRNVLAEGYQPIQIYIRNNSSKNYLFAINRVSLSCARAEEVAEKVHTSTVGRAVGYGAGAIIFWPLAVPAIWDGIKSAQANEALDIDFATKTAKDQIIQPYSHFNKILFVPSSEYQPSFTVTLIEQESKEAKTLHIQAY